MPKALGEPYTRDSPLAALLHRLLPPAARDEIERDLERVSSGHLERKALCALADEPRLIQYDHYGKRTDDLRTSEGWRGLKAAFASAGLMATPYERRHGAYSRLHWAALLSVLAPDSAMVACPYAMTDGAARVLELIGSPALKQEWLPRLLSRDPAVAIQAGYVCATAARLIAQAMDDRATGRLGRVADGDDRLQDRRRGERRADALAAGLQVVQLGHRWRPRSRPRAARLGEGAARALPGPDSDRRAHELHPLPRAPRWIDPV